MGTIAWVLLISISGYLAWNLRQLFRLHAWLKESRPTDPPNSMGLWGSVFDDIYSLQKEQFRYRAKLKKVIKRFRDSTFALADGFVMLDLDGAIDWWNPASERLLGLRKNVDKDQPATNLIRTPQFKEYFFSQEYAEPLEISSPINPSMTLQFNLAHFGKKDILMIVRDVTELKRLETVRTEFVANVSHELRTPLTVVDGYLENIADNAQIMQPKWHDAIQQMLQQTRRMKALIEDLLMLSRLETRRSADNHQEIDMSQLVASVAANLTPKLKSRNQIFESNIETSDTLLGHEEEIYSLLSNLVINASKYSPEGAHIKVQFRPDGEEVALSVSDNGAGIRRSDIPHLTERFFRVERGRTNSIEGTGLGLSIVKHILINHDATLKVESAPGKGSTFICQFPQHRVVQQKQSAETA